MFFFIAGVQPKTVTVEDHPRMCASCGLYQARLIRVDHYFSIFFIPLFRVKTGTPFVWCRRCNSRSGEAADPPDGVRQDHLRACPRCGKSVEADFSYCPYCGTGL